MYAQIEVAARRSDKAWGTLREFVPTSIRLGWKGDAAAGILSHMYQPWPNRDYPPTWRIVLAFIVAPGASALLMAIAMPAYDGLQNWFDQVWRTAQIYGALGAYPAAIALGLPAYFTLRRHFTANPLGCVIVGSLVAALPWTLLLLLGPGAGQASINGRATVINGQTTTYGWLRNAELVVTIGLFGAVGGLVLWAMAAAGHKPEAVGDDR